MKKLVCDRCGIELNKNDEIEMALEGQAAWEASAINRGIKPRGIMPCQNYARCGGEIILVTDSRVDNWQQRLKKLIGR